MKISEIIKDKYKLRIPPTVYYDLLADVVEAEEAQEPCEDCISRTELLKYNTVCKDDDGINRFVVPTEVVRNLPPVQPIRPKGKWIFKNGKYRCNVCEEKAIYRYSGSLSITQTEILTKFCPNCGAKMESEVEE